MAQIDLTTQRFAMSTRIAGNSAVEQHLRGEGGSRWSPTSSSLSMENEHEQKDFDPAHHQKKSVLTKVKEKLKHTLSNKKKPGEVEDGNSTPPSGVMEDDDEEDAEFLGAPMYESEKSPEGYKENLRQHPRADPVIAENHLLPGSVRQSSEHEEEKLHNLNPGKTQAETVYEVPASLKKLSLVETKSPPPFESSSAYCSSPRKILGGIMAETAVNSNKKMTQSMTEKLAPTHLNSSKPDHPMSTPLARLSRETPFLTPEVLAARTTRMPAGGNYQEQVRNEGVSVKESSIRKFEPGEEGPQEKTPADMGVLETMKKTVSSLLWTNEPSQSTAMHSPANASSYSPTNSNAHAGEEAESVRTLQPN